jgi:hypothetical protein
MARGVGLFFTLSFCSSVYSVYLNRGRGFVQGMLNLTYQVLAKGLIRHHLCCYKLTGHDENCYDQKGSEHEQKDGSLHTTRSTNARRSRARLRAQRAFAERSSAKMKVGDVTLAPKMSRRQTLYAS